jgi:arginyl-tRNA synthetase
MMKANKAMKETIEKLVREGLHVLAERLEQAPRDESKGREEIVVEHPIDLKNGDFTTNAALVTARQFKRAPQEIADLLIDFLRTHKPEEIEKIEMAGPGFINFYLSKEFYKSSISEIIEKHDQFGKSELYKGEKVIVEHTDPNPFKVLHIGHLMPMTIGTAIANLFRWNGAEVKEACYQGDVGLHVAKAVWAMRNGETQNAYVIGNKAFEEDPSAKEEIIELNKAIYKRTDPEINKLYDAGKKASLEYFESMYKKLGTKFDLYFFESDTAKIGERVVREHVGEVFTESEGAIVFHAEKYDPSLHTRVFINREGLPTYEAKELGLAKAKYQKFSYTKSIVVTGNEIKEYFRVLLAAMKFIYPDLRNMTKHLPHGMLRLPSGKMSSRTGDVISVEELLKDIEASIEENGNTPTNEIAVAAVKYMILKSSVGGDIVFDFEKSVSTEGDSGVYLQYAYSRANSLLEKAGKAGDPNAERQTTHEVEKLLYRFPEIVKRAGHEYAPHYLTTYLIELAGSFNNFYAHEQVIGDSPESSYRLAVVEAFKIVLKNGLSILGIPTQDRM